MTCRSAILIDNFLEQEKFDAISTQVAASASYNGSSVADLKDGLWTDTYVTVFERLKEIGLYQPHFEDAVKFLNSPLILNRFLYKPPNKI